MCRSLVVVADGMNLEEVWTMFSAQNTRSLISSAWYPLCSGSSAGRNCRHDHRSVWGRGLTKHGNCKKLGDGGVATGQYE